MVSIGCYQVQVKVDTLGNAAAMLLPAEESDMPLDWDFAWKELFEKTQVDAQGLIKLLFQEQVLGLVRYSIYPSPEKPKNIFIEQLESIPNSRGQAPGRPFEPIGKWLLWYVAQIAFSQCTENTKAPDDYLIVLESWDEAFDYYRDKVEMEYLGLGSGAPGEDAYIFAFSWDEANKFCLRQEEEYGLPLKVS